MTTKTFRDAKVEMDKIAVATDYDGDDFFYITLIEAGNAAQIQLTSSTAPALALAILEAAGYKPSPNSSFNIAASYLSQGIKKQERVTAEAKDKAELEAEALDLSNRYITELGYAPIESWDGSFPEKKSAWLAVARKAREKMAEK